MKLNVERILNKIGNALFFRLEVNLSWNISLSWRSISFNKSHSPVRIFTFEYERTTLFRQFTYMFFNHIDISFVFSILCIGMLFIYLILRNGNMIMVKAIDVEYFLYMWKDQNTTCYFNVPALVPSFIGVALVSFIDGELDGWYSKWSIFVNLICDTFSKYKIKIFELLVFEAAQCFNLYPSNDSCKSFDDCSGHCCSVLPLLTILPVIVNQ